VKKLSLLLFYAAALTVVVVLCSCASGQGTPPPGGPPDTTAPRIIGTEPVDGTVNFSGRTVAVQFDEYVEESRVPSSVIITPIPAHPPEFDWSGSTLEIEFHDQPIADRTYAITFGADIVDLSGNRMGQAVTLRFATGPKLDSGTIRGRMVGVDKRRAFVFAYRIPPDGTTFSDTLHPDSTRPDFIAPTSDNGMFSLEGLPPGRYRIFAVADEYGDQLYTPGTDAFGMATFDPVVDSSYTPVTGLTIRLAPAPTDIVPPALYSAVSINRSRTELRFSEPIDSTTLRPENFSIGTATDSATIEAVWPSTGNALAVTVAHSPLPPDSEAVARTRNLLDSTGLRIPDSSATARFTVSADADTLPPALLPIAVDTTKAYRFPDSIRIAFDEAVRVADANGAVVLRDTSGKVARFVLRRISPAEFHAFPLDTLFNTARGVVEVSLGRFTDYSGNRKDSLARIPVALAPSLGFGTVQGTLADSAAPDVPHVIVARAKSTGKEYRLRGVRAGTWEFTSIPEGEYGITAFRDDNDNGVYDYGSVRPHRPGEVFTEWQGTVNVRPRWTVNKVDLVIRR